MGDVRVIRVKQSVLANNDRRAEELRKELKEKGVFLINLMSSPGSGKTTLLVNLINKLKEKLRVGVIEADMDATVDAETIEAKTGVKTIQLHTSGECHLDAKMTQEGFESLGGDGLDLVILENIGNLVCPAEFDTGATLKMVFFPFLKAMISRSNIRLCSPRAMSLSLRRWIRKSFSTLT